MKTLLLVISLLSACTTPHAVGELSNEKLEVKGAATNGRIVMNSKKQILIREEKSAADELVVQEFANQHLQNDLSNEAWRLRQCRVDLASPSLGGSGDVGELPDISDLKTKPDVKEELGLTEDGDLNIVKESYFEQKLISERKYQKTMERMLKLVTRQKDDCERKLGYARNSHGLPAGRYEAEGYFSSKGVWVETRRGERTVSDAFEISAEKAKGSKTGTDK